MILALLSCCLVAALVSGARLWRAALRPPAPDFDAIACASTNDGIVVQTLDGLIIWANPAYLRLMRRPADQVIGQHPHSFCLPDDDPSDPQDSAAFRYDPADPAWRTLGVRRNRRGDGTVFWNQISTSFHDTADGRTLAVLVCRDVTDQVDQTRALRESTRALAHVADHDSLTGVANRNRFNAFLAAALTAAADGPAGIGVLQIDLDRFKAINDRHGHGAGDAALQHVASRMAAHLRRSDLLARMGGDEFVVICTGLAGDADLLRIARGLCDAVRPPLIHEGTELQLSVSIGAVLAGPRDRDADQLLQKSDFALYEVKRRGRGDVAIYDSDLHAEVQRRDRLAAQLRDTIEREALLFYFQPIVDLHSQRVRGLETLARWQHPTLGLVQPAVFLPLAQEMGLLRHIDRAAVSAAATLHKRLHYNGFDDIRVGINGSVHLLDDPPHGARLAAHAMRVGVATRHLVIEIAERDVFGDPDRIAARLAAVTRLVDDGFGVLIDGFGAGYAGLLHVEQLAIAGFKIEKALIRHLDTAPACERITGMLLQFGQEKAITCVASGIETAAQAEMVRALGGSVGQGNHFARAMPSGDVLDWLRHRQTLILPPPDHRSPIAPPRLAR